MNILFLIEDEEIFAANQVHSGNASSCLLRHHARHGWSGGGGAGWVGGWGGGWTQKCGRQELGPGIRGGGGARGNKNFGCLLKKIF